MVCSIYCSHKVDMKHQEFQSEGRIRAALNSPPGKMWQLSVNPKDKV